MKLPHSGPIAQAVAGEVDRLCDFTSSFSQSEGAAYKAAWDRQGSDALKHCESFRRDCLIASLIAQSGMGGGSEFTELVARQAMLIDADMVRR